MHLGWTAKFHHDRSTVITNHSNTEKECEEIGVIAVPEERFSVLPKEFRIQEWEDPDFVIAADACENRLDGRIGEGGVQISCAFLWGRTHDSSGRVLDGDQTELVAQSSESQLERLRKETRQASRGRQNRDSVPCLRLCGVFGPRHSAVIFGHWQNNCNGQECPSSDDPAPPVRSRTLRVHSRILA